MNDPVSLWLAIAAIVLPTLAQVAIGGWQVRVAKNLAAPERYPLPADAIRKWLAEHAEILVALVQLVSFFAMLWLFLATMVRASDPPSKRDVITLVVSASVLAFQIALALVGRTISRVLEVILRVTQAATKLTKVTGEFVKVTDRHVGVTESLVKRTERLEGKRNADSLPPTHPGRNT